jgi:hypothetical protein
VQASPLYALYAQVIDRDSAHEILAGRIASAKADARASGTAGSSGGDPTDRQPVRERREVERAAERQAKASEREAKAGARRRVTEAAAARRRAEQDARRRERMLEDLGEDLVRGVFGTLFGR